MLIEPLLSGCPCDCRIRPFSNGLAVTTSYGPTITGCGVSCAPTSGFFESRLHGSLAAGEWGFGSDLDLIASLLTRSLDWKFIPIRQGLWDEQKAQALADADCFCLPSESENFGTAALEAAGVGLPVVLLDRCGGAELLGPQASVVFDHGDTAGLAHALRKVLDDGSAAGASRAAAPGLRESLDWATLAGDQERIYESVLRASKGAGMKFQV